MKTGNGPRLMNENSIQRIERPELISEQTYENIRQLIINCQLQPGLPFVEADIARRLGISRSPLREAVRRLEEEGFIETVDGRRRVAPITAGKVLQLYELRCVLEKHAADKSEGLISRMELERVTSRFDYIAAQLDENNVQPFNDADFEFHQLFIGRCGNPLMIAQLSRLEMQLRRVMNFFGRRVGHTKLAFQEHLEIVETIRSPRPGALGKAVEHHILAVGRRVSEFVREKQDGGIGGDSE
ncbi:GntR family transcriptional regulator [Mesorhizobium sp. BR1-1-2]|uniref:GntR family transcriptional regulator n=1 Tax=Mesorhizobium sp. BR1-1-2 TaxID=2876652 RepID=UPI001CCEF506|nr:GntR family transcriptional regulator [Mesorhizobium sp. BR1-1-2]MBZ9965665.1 GntR family transcriptional regulator [Mesorhizobium sp. BR1-1-2]